MIWTLARPFGWRLAGAGLLAAGTELAGLALMATATWLLVTAAQQPPLQALTVAIVTVRALAISRGTLRYAERLAGHDAVLRMVTDVRAKIFASLIDRPAGTRGAELRRGDVLSRVVSDVDAVQDAVIRVALPAAAAGTVAVLAVAGAWLLDPITAVVLAAGLLATSVLLPFVAGRLAAVAALRLAPLKAAYAVDTIDLVHGAADLAAFGARDRFEAVGAAHAEELSTLERRLARQAFALDGLATVLTAATAIAVLLTALRQGVAGVWVPVLAVATLSTGELAMSLLAAARKRAEIAGSLRRVEDLLSTCPSQDSPRPVPAGPLTLELAGAAVTHPGSTRPALREISLRIAAGTRLAVVGPSGAGKSTLLGVLTGQVSVTAGSATANGVPIAELDRQAWSQSVSGLLADTHIFHATVRDNLRLGRPAATDAELTDACAVAGLGPWIAEHGLDVLVGEDGAQLSGGQRQRLALARALLADPGVLLLDEPTEGLDPRQADEVLDAILRHRAGRTVVLVTHRLVGLDLFDEVLVLDGGRVLERGSYQGLQESDGWVRAHAI